MIFLCYDRPKKADTVVKERIEAHVGELKGHADLGPKPKSVQPIRGEVYSAKEQTGENPVFKHVDQLKWQASLKGEPAPLQPNPAEQQAAERLGKPPPQGEAVVFRHSRSQPEQQCRGSRKPEPLPRSKKDRISELIELYQTEIHLPSLMADLTPEEEAQLEQWANSLSFKELGQEIRKRQKKLDKDMRDQWPTGLVRA